jgi:hypothetical protein
MSEAAPTGWTFLIGTPVFGLFGPAGHPQVPGSALFLAATLHAIAAISVMARAPKAAGAAA